MSITPQGLVSATCSLDRRRRLLSYGITPCLRMMKMVESAGIEPTLLEAIAEADKGDLIDAHDLLEQLP